MKTKTKFSVLALIIFLCAIISFYAFSANSFENQISQFPYTYKVKLRELHKKYPNWKFVCVKTGLNWYDAVNGESDYARSAVPKYSSDLCKSYASGYYYPDSDTFKETDAGWVNASPDTVAYFLDPRNFLTETDIFQFELLSFSSHIKVTDVDQILKGTFMYNTKITYYDKDGKLKKTSLTYAECIYNAGKTNNVNPCFLASKIRNEIVVAGGGPSGSVTGTYSGYEGYYNFFNIGAYSGATPIANGLKYASTSGSYERPWNTPEKSINGGAQFLAESYIAKGQDTGYFQKFNTSPDAVNDPYTHQYMTNVSGADSQGYSTYLSYYEDGLLDLARTFAIPVYDDMPGLSSQMKNFKLFDSEEQLAKPTTALNVRTEPNTSGTVIVTLDPDTTVTVLSKRRNSSSNYYQHLYYPYWYYVSFTQGGESYKGYAVADYLTLNSYVSVKNGSVFELPWKSTGSEKPTFYTWNTSNISINDDGSVEALKSGTAYISATTSAGGYDYIKLNIGSADNSSLKVSGFEVKPNSTGVTFSWKKNADASGYELLVYDGNKVVYTKNISDSKTSLNVISLKSSSGLTAKIRAYKKSGKEKINGVFSSIKNFTVRPDRVSGLSCYNIKTDSFTLKWNSAKNVDGYEILKYDSDSKKYSVVKSTKKTKYTFSNQKNGVSNLYIVRAYVENGGERIRGNSSKSVYGYTYKTDMGNPSKVSAKRTVATVKWKKVSGADKYIAYKFDTSKNAYVKCGESATDSFKFTSLHSGQKYSLKIEAVKVGDGYNQILGVSEFSVKTTTKQITGLKMINSTGYKATVEWKKKTGADSYCVYVYDEKKSKFVLYKETKNNSCDISLKPLKSKVIKVRACVVNYSSKSYSEFSETINVYSGPKKVTSVKLTSLGYNKVSMKWNKVSGAKGYYVYFVSKDNKLSLIEKTKTNSVKIKNLNGSKSYSIRILPYRTLKSGTEIKGSYSDKFSFKTPPKKISDIKVTGISTGKYTLNWAEDKKADGYIIYKYNKSSDKFEYFSETTKTKLTVKKLYSAKKDSYKIAGYVILDKIKYVGKLSSKFSVSTSPKKPENVSAVKTEDGSVNISWKKSPRADGTRIYVYDNNKSKWVYIGYTDKNTYKISSKKIPSGVVKISVRSYVKIDSVRYYSRRAVIKMK